MTQVMLMKKLSSYDERHPLLQALAEYNHLITAQYLLDYINDANLRQYVQRALNRGEAYHQYFEQNSDKANIVHASAAPMIFLLQLEVLHHGEISPEPQLLNFIRYGYVFYAFNR
ncbi:hypothetical protein AB835_02585 [Candidatus Endobugula sertula]|uniref:Tn3 transposase DDE domain-containing protein n=1 Tax=Candidatus Endobugula sertula TaxID=62101 RepID=A0A1D2QSS0_9GAMM|nr:hypothetical protein AB835_02585 [Candidatus Endobugula sertula]